MVVLKKGSKGEDVKILQKTLGLTADGIFGSGTESKVKEFQASHGLTADGIVGQKTWDLINKINKSDLEIIQKPLSVSLTKSPNRPITYLVIHFTAGSNSKKGKAISAYNTFSKGKSSADFGVDDEQIVQFNPDIKNKYCWAVGGSNYNNNGGKLYGKAVNKNCISIEICSTCTPSTTQAVSTSNHKGWSFTDAALNNAVKLARHLMKIYNIPIERVIRHYDITGKLCPGIIGWNNEPLRNIDGTKTGEMNNSKEWEKFKNQLK